MKEFGRIEDIERELDIDNLEELRKIFLEPKISEDYDFSFHKPDTDAVLEYLCQERGFSEVRTATHLAVIDEGLSARQQTLDSWFG